MTQLEYVYGSAIIKNNHYKNVHKIETCTYFSKSTFSMVNHVRRHPLPPLFDCQRNDPELYCCKNCDSSFDSIIMLRKHMKEEHQIGELEYTLRSYICHVCSFETHSALQWFKHSRCSNDKERSKIQNKQKPEKKYKCHECGSFHETISNLVRHLLKCSFKKRNKSHLNEGHIYDEMKKWYDCDNTLWSYCDMCPFKTLNKSYLKKHVITRHQIYDNKDWFRCDKCTFKTLSESYLKAHFLAEHVSDENKNWLQCDKCQYKTLWQPKFQHHLFTIHKNDNKN